jgi:hypothetical protein
MNGENPVISSKKPRRNPRYEEAAKGPPILAAEDPGASEEDRDDASIVQDEGEVIFLNKKQNPIEIS